MSTIKNRLVEVKKNDVTTSQFTYDGDGQRVKSVVNGETIQFVNNYYEKKGSEITKYYFAGASRVAMRKYTVPVSMEVEYFLGDHLGSTSVTTDSSGVKVSEMRYSPWGEVRYHWVDSNLSTTPAYTLPKFTFTGQRSYMDDPSTPGVEGFGLLDYNARFYDPMTGRFTIADTIVPGGVQGLDRYAYVNNSPIVFIDPSGHDPAGNCYDQGYCDKEPLKPLLKYQTETDQSFTDDEIQMFESDAQATAEALAQQMNSNCSEEDHWLGLCTRVTPQEAFYAVYGGPITVKRVDDTCQSKKGECYAELKGTDHGNYTIWVYSNASAREVVNSPGLLIHEMGHAFHHASGFSLNLPGANVLNSSAGLHSDYTNRSSDETNEIFADMFTGWVYGAWETNPNGPEVFTIDGEGKMRYMEQNMSTYIQRAVENTWALGR